MAIVYCADTDVAVEATWVSKLLNVYFKNIVKEVYDSFYQHNFISIFPIPVQKRVRRYQKNSILYFYLPLHLQ